MPFNIEDGKTLNNDDGGEDYTDVTKEYLIKKMKEDKLLKLLLHLEQLWVLGFPYKDDRDGWFSIL